jgi:hypothetical protein
MVINEVRVENQDHTDVLTTALLLQSLYIHPSRDYQRHAGVPALMLSTGREGAFLRARH